MSLIRPNCASRSGCWLPSFTRDMPCRLYPSARIIRATASFCTANPSPAIFCPISRSDRMFQVIAAIGSPRRPASSTPSSACLNPGWASSAFGRPAPGRRDRPGSSAARASSSAASRNPAATVVSDTPDARATAAIPPCPSARASVPR